MKSEAYAKVKVLILAGHIKDFQQIAIEVQKKTLAKDMGKGFESLMARVYDPGKWTIHELAQLSDLLEIDHGILLLMADRIRKKKGKK
jgi:hypothetical protein